MFEKDFLKLSKLGIHDSKFVTYNYCNIALNFALEGELLTLTLTPRFYLILGMYYITMQWNFSKTTGNFQLGFNYRGYKWLPLIFEGSKFRWFALAIVSIMHCIIVLICGLNFLWLVNCLRKTTNWPLKNFPPYYVIIILVAFMASYDFARLWKWNLLYQWLSTL